MPNKALVPPQHAKDGRNRLMRQSSNPMMMIIRQDVPLPPDCIDFPAQSGDADSPSLNNPCEQQSSVCVWFDACPHRGLSVQRSVYCRDLARPAQAALPDSGNCEARHRIAFFYLRLHRFKNFMRKMTKCGRFGAQTTSPAATVLDLSAQVEIQLKREGLSRKVP